MFIFQTFGAKQTGNAVTLQVSADFNLSLVDPRLMVKLGMPVTEKNIDQVLAGYGVKIRHPGDEERMTRAVQSSSSIDTGGAFFQPSSAFGPKPINFEYISSNVYPNSTRNVVLDRDGHSAASMSWGARALTDFKRDGALTTQRPATQINFQADDFENGAGNWGGVGSLAGYDLQMIKQAIIDSGSLSISWSSNSFNYSYRCDELVYNKLHGMLTINDSQGNQIYSGERFLRGVENASSLDLFITPSWEYERSLKSRRFVSFYYENLPNASQPGNLGQIQEIMSNYVASRLGLPTPDYVSIWYSGGQDQYRYKAIFTVLVDVKNDGSTTVPWADGYIFSEKALKQNIPFAFGIGMPKMAKYTDPKKLASTEITMMHLFGRWDEQGNVIEQALVLPISTSVKDQPTMPASSYLAQNYPNPFNAETTIPFILPNDSHVKIEIFNQLGQSVATLTDEPHMAGRHEVRFSAGSLPSGVYTCRLTAGDLQDVKKIVLMK